MSIDEITTLISTVGFPIFVAVWMLYKSDKAQKESTDAISNNTKVLQELIDLIRGDDR